MKIDNRQQFLVVLTIVAVALFVGVNWVITPLVGKWSDRQKQIKNLHAKIDDGQKLIKRGADIHDRWVQMQAHSLPADSSLAESQLFDALDGWSKGSGTELASLMPQWKSDATNYLTLACRVEASGNLASLSKFLYSLEKGPMPLRLDSVELGAHDKEGQQMTLSTEINGLALLPQK